jgi:hypothetical protein
MALVFCSFLKDFSPGDRDGMFLPNSSIHLQARKVVTPSKTSDISIQIQSPSLMCATPKM